MRAPVLLTEVQVATLAAGDGDEPGAVVAVRLVIGRAYEVRGDVDLHVAEGLRTTLATSDIMVRPDAPLAFVSLTGTVTVAAASTEAGSAWFAPVAGERAF